MNDKEFEEFVDESTEEESLGLLSMLFNIPVELLEARMTKIRGEKLLTFEDFDSFEEESIESEIDYLSDGELNEIINDLMDEDDED